MYEKTTGFECTASGLVLNECGFDEWYGSKESIRQGILKGMVLVVGSGSNGRSFLFSQAERMSETGGIAGVEPKTIAEIALPIVAEALVKTKSDDELKKIKLHPISSNTASGIILGIIRKESGLPKEMLTKNTADELLRIINMLRINGCTETVNSHGFDVDATRKSYEKYLSDSHLYDTAGLLTEAIAYLEKPENREMCTALMPEYALLNDHTPSKLEKKLLALLTGGKCSLISADTNTSVKPAFFKTYGMSDEILTIARRIKKENIHPGDVVIYYTDSSYINVIRAVFGASGIPVYLLNGKPAEETGYFRLWLALLDWWKNDCGMKYFESIVLNGCIELSIKKEDDKKHSAKEAVMDYFRRNSGYLFGRENLMNIAGLNKVSAEETEKDFTDAGELAIFFVSELVGIFCDKTDDNGYTQINTFKPLKLFERLSAFADKYGTKGKKYKTARNMLLEVLSGNDSDYIYDDFYDLMVKLIGSLHISEKTDADAVLAVGLSAMKSIPMRKNVFIVGMSSSLMQQKTDESPLLSDEKIKELLGDENLAALYQGCAKNDLMLRSVEYLKASISGKDAALTVSYPYYDQSDLRLRSSSYIIESLLDGDDIKEDSNSLSFLNSCETFAEKNKQNIFLLEPAGGDKTDDADQQNIFCGIKDAVSTKKKSEDTDSDKTETDIKEQTEEAANENLDDDKLQLRLTASSFHTLLCCPRKYAIEKLFYISAEPDEQISHSWLTPANKGRFFHSVMEQYLEMFCLGNSEAIKDEKGNNAELYYDEKMFSEVFENVRKQYSLIPFELASEKDRELSDIKEIAKTYLKSLCEEKDGFAPFKMEYKFTETVSDDLDDVKLNYWIGFLDRVDAAVKDKKLHFRIVDYKTGKMENFIRDYTGILVQHYVYIKALTNELNSTKTDVSQNVVRQYFEKLKSSGQVDSAVVDSFVFVFPFEEDKVVYKYDGENFIKSDEKTTFTKVIFEGEPMLNKYIKALIKKIEAAFKKGEYPDYTFDDDIAPQRGQKENASLPNDVNYCPYKEICGGCRKEDGTK